MWRCPGLEKIISTCKTYTPPETNSSPLKMDAWNTTFLSYWGKRPIFRCENVMLVSGRVDVSLMIAESMSSGLSAPNFSGGSHPTALGVPDQRSHDFPAMYFP